MVGVGASAAAAAAAGGLFGYRILNRPRPKNVVFIVADALRADRLGCYGYQRQGEKSGRFISPAIDRLAREGLLFERCLAQSSWTLPSTASYMASRIPFVAGERYNEGFITDRCSTTAEILAERGWLTLALVTNPYLYMPAAGGGRKLAVARGFSRFVPGSASRLPNPLHERGIGRPEVLASFTQAQEAVEKALGLISQRVSRARPFFLYIHLMDTHEPYNPPEAYKELVAAVPPVEGVPDYLLYQAIRTNAEKRGEERLAEEDMAYFERARELYDASIRYLDEWVGTLVNFLKANGLWESTLVLFSSDHGEEFGEHGWIGHSTTLYDECLHVPLIAAGRGAAAGRRVSSPVSLLDLAPTILASCGIEAPGEMQGAALDLSGGERRSGRATISTLVRPDVPAPLYEKKYALTHPAGKKLIRTEYLDKTAQKPDKVELYDLTSDPGETNDIAAANPSEVETLQAELDRRMGTAEVEEGEPFTVDEEARRVLESLGYLH